MPQQPGLTDAGFTGEKNDVSATVGSRTAIRRESFNFAFASNNYGARMTRRSERHDDGRFFNGGRRPL